MKTDALGVPTDDALIAHTILRMRIARRRMPIMNLPDDALHELGRRALDPKNPTLGHTIRWLSVRHGVAVSDSALSRFNTAFARYAVQVHDAVLVGVGLGRSKARRADPDNVGQRLVEHRRRHEQRNRQRVQAGRTTRKAV